jgi:hypothetical protein
LFLVHLKFVLLVNGQRLPASSNKTEILPQGLGTSGKAARVNSRRARPVLPSG